MTNMEAIGRRIAMLRHQSGITQDTLGAAIGMSRSSLASIERGHDRPGLAAAIAIADYFKVPMDWLLGRSTPAGGPLTTQTIDRHDELAWINYWRSLAVEERRAVVRLLNVADTDNVAA